MRQHEVLPSSHAGRSNTQAFGQHRKRNRPIGIFDSGLGGLTVVRAIRKRLPAEDIVYLGDVARLPYGIKSPSQIIACSKQNTEFLMKWRPKALVVACNSSSGTSLHTLRMCYRLPLIVDVIGPAARAALQVTTRGRVGLLGTQATIASHAYERALRRLSGARHIRLFSSAAPLLVPLVESGWMRERVTKDILIRYLKPLLARHIDTLILGCTHYPLLKSLVCRCVGDRVSVIDSAPHTAEDLDHGLERLGLRASSNGRKGKLRVCLTDMPADFRKIGERFLGERLGSVKKVIVQ